MKFLSFNVNSLRAYLSKDLLSQWYNPDIDIIAIEETKLSDSDIEKFPLKLENYNTYFTISKIKKGYSGTAVLSKEKPLNVFYGLDNNKYDDEGRVITLEFDRYYFICLYVPNSGEELKRLNFRLEFESDLRNYVSKLLKKKEVIITGDLNVAHNEIDLKNPDSNHFSAGFTDEERNEFSKLLNLGFIDTFRYLHPEEKKYSYWSYRMNARKTNAGWRIDYFLVSNNLKDKIKQSEILNDVFGSDHCPVLLELDI